MAFDEDRERYRMLRLDDRALARESSHGNRPATLDEAARAVSGEYREIGDRRDDIEERSKQLDDELANARFAAQQASAARENRWRNMGWSQRLMHRIAGDTEIIVQQGVYNDAMVRAAMLIAQKADVALELGKIEREAAEALEKARPEAEAALADRQKRTELAEEILHERQADRQRAQEEQQRINEIETYNNTPPAWELDRINERALNREYDDDELGL